MKIKEMALISLMCAVICVISPFAVPLPFSPVPVTLSTFVLYLSIFLLKRKQALCACLVYLILGMTGLPVFSGFSGGAARLAGPTGGYLIGYLCLVLVSTVLLERLPSHFAARCVALAVGTAVCYLLGTCWLCLQMDIGFGTGIAMAVLPYLPLDAVKICMAAVIGPKAAAAVRRAI